jgi:hypothetical protein
MAEEKKCVVCGVGSHREEWDKTLKGFVACDHHSDQELKDAVKTAAGGPTTKSEAAPAAVPIRGV